MLEHVFNINELLSELNRVLKPNGMALITTPFMGEEHEMPYDFARYTTPALLNLYKKNGFTVDEHHKLGNGIHVVFQFCINYCKNTFLKNKILRQLLLIPFIFIFNMLALILGLILPKDNKSYFNNIFILSKK